MYDSTDPFPLNSKELSDVRTGVHKGRLSMQFGTTCKFHAERCDGHWHIAVTIRGKGKARDKTVEKTVDEKDVETLLSHELSLVKGYMFKRASKKAAGKVLN